MNVNTGKEHRLNIRVKEEFKDDLKEIAHYHGLTVASYVHSVLVKAIRRERAENPEIFAAPAVNKSGIRQTELQAVRLQSEGELNLDHVHPDTPTEKLKKAK